MPAHQDASPTAILPPVSTLLRVGGSGSGSSSNGGHHHSSHHHRNRTSSSSPSPPCSPRTPADALLPEPDIVRVGTSSSRSPSLASLALAASEHGAAGSRRPPPPPLTLLPLSSLGKPRMGRSESDERCSIRSLLNGTGNVTPRTAKKPPSQPPSPPVRSTESERDRFAYAPPPPPPPSAPGRRSIGNEYHSHPPPPPPPATAPAHPDYHHQLHHYQQHQHHHHHHTHPAESARRHSYHPHEYYGPPPPPPPPHAHYAGPQQAYHIAPVAAAYAHHHPGYEHATVFYPPPGLVSYDPMAGLGTRAPISRTTKACDACRARKVRCDAGGYPSGQGTCSRCRESDRTCVYTATQKKRGPCPGRPARAASSGSSGPANGSTGRRASLESREASERRQAWQAERHGMRSAPAHPVDAWPWSDRPQANGHGHGQSHGQGHGQQPHAEDRYHPYRRDAPRTAPVVPARQSVGGWDSSPNGHAHGQPPHDLAPPEHSPRHLPAPGPGPGPGYEQHYGMRPHDAAGWPAPPLHAPPHERMSHRRRSMSPPPHRV